MDSIRILSTKKLLDNQKQLLMQANINLVEEDFIATQTVNFSFESLHDYSIITSQNAVKSLLSHQNISQIKQKKCFCVGIKTKIALEKEGFEIVVYTDYAAVLATIITNQYSQCSFTFFCGNLRRDALPEALHLAGITLQEIRVYETKLVPHKILSTVNGILFFSPSGVESYLQQNTISNEMCFCIGSTTAEALQSITKQIVISKPPTVEKTIESCLHFYSNQLIDTDKK